MKKNTLVRKCRKNPEQEISKIKNEELKEKSRKKIKQNKKQNARQEE